MNTISDIPGLKTLWKETYGDRRVCIAILDGPVDATHSSLHGANLTTAGGTKLPGTKNSPSAQHGTHVASIIFGQHGQKVQGVAPGCRGIIIPIFQDDDTASPVCTQEQLASAIQSAIDAGAQIINISAGQAVNTGEVGAALDAAIRKCREFDILVVAAAGNEQGCTELLVPGALPSVLAVASSGSTITARQVFNAASLTRPPNCILAPGYNIRGALPEDSVDYKSGSSYAAAIVSGVAALLLSLQLKYKGTLNTLQVQQILLRSAEKEDHKPAYSPAGFLNIPGAASLLKKEQGRVMHGISGNKIEFAENKSNRLVLSSRWSVNPKALKERYVGVASEKFGSVDIHIPGKSTYNIPDLHYPTDNGRPDMYLLPVSEESPIVLRGGEIVSGCTLVDQLLRLEMHLSSQDPVYALLSYIRPEEHTVTFLELPETKLRMSHQHLAAYAGGGRTIHALHSNTDWRGESLLNMKWNVDRHPANVQILELQGVLQATLNRNALIVETILAAAVKSPVNTEVLRCRTVDINTILQFYRDTIRKADYLEDFSWYTNCAVQKTIAINVLLNVPHNESAFREIFGEDGTQLWKDFLLLYREISNQDFESAYETDFIPLWKLEGLTPGQIKPLTYREYNQFFAAKTEGRLKGYQGTVPIQPGIGMAWPLETVVDVIRVFFETYIALDDWDVITSLSMLLFLRHEFQKRAGIAADSYLELVSPVIAEVVFAEGCDKSEELSRLNKFTESIFEMVTEFDNSCHYTTELYMEQYIEDCIQKARRLLDENTENRKMPSSRQSMHNAFDKLKNSLQETGQADLFTTPSILHKIAIGAYKRSPFVTIRTICTVLDSSELIEHEDNCFQPASGMKTENYIPYNPSNLVLKPTKENSNMEKNVSTLNSVPEKKEEVVVSPQSCSDPDKKCNKNGQSSLVYAFGRIGYKFISSSRRDSIKHQMGETKDPGDPAHLLEYLKANTYEAASIQWTLNLEGTPIYMITPQGPYAREAYDLLIRFLQEQTFEGVERVSVPGYVIGYADIGYGGEVPVVVPEIRGMYSWTTRALVDAVVGDRPVGQEEMFAYDEKMSGVENFLERVYYEMRNLGRQPNERALNFAATNAFQVERIYENALREEMELESINVEPNPLAREGTEHWDVKLTFFFPRRETRSPLKIYRFTVDVSDVVPVVVGPTRSWFAPLL